MRRTKRGQVAVEFISTYSWAILGVLIAIGAVSYFDLMSPSRYIQEKCVINKQLECMEVQFDNTGDFAIIVRNNYPVDLTLDQVTVYQEDGTSFTAIDIPVQKGQESAPITGTLSPRREGQKAELGLNISFKRDNPEGPTIFNVTGKVVTKTIRP